jgi:hypothetical protein
MFFAFPALFVCKLLKISKLLVEAAGVEPDTRVENTQLIHSRNAPNPQNSMKYRFAYKSRTNNSQNARTSRSFTFLSVQRTN